MYQIISFTDTTNTLTLKISQDAKSDSDEGCGKVYGKFSLTAI